MKVTAIKKGYYGKTFIRPGQSFELKAEGDFSAKWMEKSAAEKKPATKVEKKSEPKKKAAKKSEDKAVI